MVMCTVSKRSFANGDPADCKSFLQQMNGDQAQTLLRLALVGANLSLIKQLRDTKASVKNN